MAEKTSFDLLNEVKKVSKPNADLVTLFGASDFNTMAAGQLNISRAIDISNRFNVFSGDGNDKGFQVPDGYKFEVKAISITNKFPPSGATGPVALDFCMATSNFTSGNGFDNYVTQLWTPTPNIFETVRTVYAFNRDVLYQILGNDGYGGVKSANVTLLPPCDILSGLVNVANNAWDGGFDPFSSTKSVELDRQPFIFYPFDSPHFILNNRSGGAAQAILDYYCVGELTPFTGF